MLYHLSSSVSSIGVAQVLGIPFDGDNIELTKVSSLKYIEKGCISYSTELIDEVPEGGLVITPTSNKPVTNGLVSNNPRLDFIRVLGWLIDNCLLEEKKKGFVHPDAYINSTSVIEDGAQIGRGCVIGPYSHISRHVVLGENVKIGNSVIIGHDGFGFERDENGTPHHFPHLGQVVIGDNVEIGNLCTIARGNLENTCIESDVKIDDHVYIAHNVKVIQKTLVMSGVHLNGRVQVGEGCWLGTGALVREGQVIGDRAIIGMGSVVVSDVASGSKVAGNPAREI